MTDPLDTMLADLRADVPEMSDQAFDGGRARVLAVADPVAVTTTLEPEPVVVALPKRRALRSPPGRLVRLVASAAAVVALTVGVMAIQSSSHQAPVATAAAALNAAADNITPTDPPIEADQYRYSAKRSWAIEAWHADGGYPGFRVMVEELTERWWAPQNGTDDWLQRYGPTGKVEWLEGTPEGAAQRGWKFGEAWSKDLDIPCLRPDDCDSSVPLMWKAMHPKLIDELSRDPATILEQLESHSTTSQPSTEMGAVATLLGTGWLPADLRAAVYRAIALIPGVEITETVANLDGREGMAFGVVEEGMRVDLIIDTTTGEFIGERTVLTEPNYQGPAGTVTYYSSITTGVADEIGVRPAG